MNITKKFTVIMICSLSLFSVGGYLVAKDIYDSQIIETARNTANYVRDVGTWASQYGSIYTQDEKSTHLAQKKVAEFSPENLNKAFTEEDMKTISFFSKNPALIQREFADVVAKSDNTIKSRLTAENYMNPNNKPTSWEFDTIQTIKSKKLPEYGTIQDGHYLYAKTIYMKATCLKCHGDPDTAPEGVTKLYGKINGFGFKEGDVAGIISVRVPYEFNFSKINFFKSLPSFVALVCFLFSLIIPVVYILLYVLRPLKSKINEINMLAKGKITQETLTIHEPNSKNEIVQLHNSIARLGKNMYLFFKQNKAKMEEHNKKDISDKKE